MLMAQVSTMLCITGGSNNFGCGVNLLYSKGLPTIAVHSATATGSS